ncbi:hypothetical protein [Streptomyces sp. NPDC024089]|uniref:hypothetical protein n=1 Tax=Streptomyces sp. NPDC024089 TaxID=3154328 RepID=UPI0033F13B75
MAGVHGRERWLYVPVLGSRAGYQDMELFIDGFGDAALADRLRTTSGRRGFALEGVRSRDARSWLPAPPVLR